MGKVRDRFFETPIDLLYGWSAGSPEVLKAPVPRSGIPKLIHTMYGLWDDSAPGLAERFILGGWVRRNPDWTVVLWRRAELESFLESDYPQYFELYTSFTRGVQKADLLRYLLVFHYGGVYCDLDLYCSLPLAGSVDGCEALFHTEAVLTTEQSVNHGRKYLIRQGVPEKEQRIANYFFAATPGHPVLERVLELVVERAGVNPSEDYDVLYITGPDVVTEAVLGHPREHLRILSLGEGNQMVQHLHLGTWRDEKDRIKATLLGRVSGRLDQIASGRLGRFVPFGRRRKEGSNLQFYRNRMGRLPHLRAGSFDSCIWNEVPREYSTLPSSFRPDDVVLDLGVHVGAFSAWAALRGAPRVIGFEASRKNFDIARLNLRDLKACELHHAAVWRSDEKQSTELVLVSSTNPENTGGNSLVGRVHGSHLPAEVAPALALDDVLSNLSGVRFLKVDIEGSEFPVLATSKQLHKVFEIVGEYHTGDSYRMEDDDFPLTMEWLAAELFRQGFWVIWRPADDSLGLFFASREKSLFGRLQRCFAFGYWARERGLFWT